MHLFVIMNDLKAVSDEFVIYVRYAPSPPPQ